MSGHSKHSSRSRSKHDSRSIHSSSLRSKDTISASASSKTPSDVRKELEAAYEHIRSSRKMRPSEHKAGHDILKAGRKTPSKNFRQTASRSRKYYSSLVRRREASYRARKAAGDKHAHKRRPVPRGTRDNLLISLGVYRRKGGSGSYAREHSRIHKLQHRDLKKYYKKQHKLREIRNRLEKEGLADVNVLGVDLNSHESRSLGGYSSLVRRHNSRKRAKAEGRRYRISGETPGKSSKYLRLASKSLKSYKRSVLESRRRRAKYGKANSASFKYKMRRFKKNIHKKERALSSLRKKLSKLASNKTTYMHNKARLSHYKHKLESYREQINRRKEEIIAEKEQRMREKKEEAQKRKNAKKLFR